MNDPAPTTFRFSRLQLAAFLAVVCICLVLLPAVIDSRSVARRSSCTNNLHNILLAMRQYHDDHGCYPSSYIADADGRPMHSWRVLLLPYLDQKDVYDQYRFDEPWDGPNNRKLHDITLKPYLCPSQEPHPTTQTSYVLVIGPKTYWPTKGNGYFRDADIINGLSNTLLVVEVADSGIHWMEPRDLQIDQIPMEVNSDSGLGISSHHEGGANVGFADGSVRFLDNKTAPEDLRALLTPFGRDKDRLPTIRNRR
jgi:prepilin-type processing-associated H-X9-DG protein